MIYLRHSVTQLPIWRNCSLSLSLRLKFSFFKDPSPGKVKIQYPSETSYTHIHPVGNLEVINSFKLCHKTDPLLMCCSNWFLSKVWRIQSSILATKLSFLTKFKAVRKGQHLQIYIPEFSMYASSLQEDMQHSSSYSLSSLFCPTP